MLIVFQLTCIFNAISMYIYALTVRAPNRLWLLLCSGIFRRTTKREHALCFSLLRLELQTIKLSSLQGYSTISSCFHVRADKSTKKYSRKSNNLRDTKSEISSSFRLNVYACKNIYISHAFVCIRRRINVLQIYPIIDCRWETNKFSVYVIANNNCERVKSSHAISALFWN